MPIFEYRCRACDRQFETLVRGADIPSCSACGSADLERLLSLPALKSAATHRRALDAARHRDAKLGSEKARAQREYELGHND